MAKGELIAAFDFSNVAADEFNDWYDLEHIPERQRVPGFLSCQRWIGAENAKDSVATYDLDTLAVLKSPPYLAIRDPSLREKASDLMTRLTRKLIRETKTALRGDPIVIELHATAVFVRTKGSCRALLNSWTGPNRFSTSFCDFNRIVTPHKLWTTARKLRTNCVANFVLDLSDRILRQSRQSHRYGVL